MDTALARHVAERATERGKVAEAGQGERHEEPVVGRYGDRRSVIEALELERDAAALRVVVPVDALLADRFARRRVFPDFQDNYSGDFHLFRIY